MKSKTVKKEVFEQATREDKTIPGQREHNALAIRDRPEWPSPSASSRGTEMSLFIVHSAVILCETVIGLQNGHYPARTKPQKPSTTDATRSRRLSDGMRTLTEGCASPYPPKKKKKDIDERTLKPPNYSNFSQSDCDALPMRAAFGVGAEALRQDLEVLFLFENIL
ncbi:hypothetical protein E2C01_026212 [Portunus trituberculatus]|uniref:Uncharacterized protein n=1 Tax=Portunus trituberculatus TaxID=210409 RepID=A0A5B7EI10_PORTR|nr:hypothetical protein [Portunus trituberculatus]